jgi:xylulokinase
LDYQFLQIVQGFESALGARPEKIVAVGGAIHNAFWMQNKADVVGRPIEVPELDEAVPLGAALLAGIGVGLYRDEEDAFCQVYRPGRTYHPRLELTAQYARWFEIFADLYGSLRDVNRRLREAF